MEQLIAYIKLVYANFGWAGLVVAYFLADKWLYPLWKKKQGNWVSYERLDEKLKNMEGLLQSHVVEDRKIKADLDVLNASYEITSKNTQESVARMADSIEAVRKELSDLMNILIQRK